LAEFQERVRTTALPEERRVFAEFFLRWAASLTPSDLGETEQIRRLTTLTEVEPDVYLVCLHRLIGQASDEEIRTIRNEEHEWVPTGSRRNLVWLLERLVWFPEYFDRSEEILLRLATNETETDIGNNATVIWIRLYSPALPGTAVPFGERLAKLRQRTLASDQHISDLAFTALGEVFSTSLHRMEIPALGGRVRPREANPRTVQEWAEYVRATLSLIADLSGNPDRKLKRKAQATVSKNVRVLLATGHLEQLQEVLKPGEIDEENLAHTLNGVDEFLHFEGAATSSAGSDYINQVRAWRRALQPLDIHARLVSSVGIEPWRSSMVGENDWRAELRALAGILAGDSEALTAEIPWLCSERAKAAAYLGEELAKADSGGRLLETLIEAAVRYGEGALARGYVIGAARNPRLDIGKLNSLLDQVEASNPPLAFDIFRVGGSTTGAVERTIALVDEGKLPLTYFRAFTIGDFQPDSSQLQAVLERLVSAAEKSDVQATEIALEVFGYRIVSNSQWHALLGEHDIQELAWRLAAAAAGDAGRESFWWAELVKKLGQFDARRAARIASTGLVSARFNQAHSASDVLTELAKEHAEEVMDELGSLILDDSKGGWRVLIGKYPVFAQLPWEVVAKWIKDHGVAAAKRLAGQLPPPYVSEDGSPTVPPLTAFVLSEFENSDEVFRAFVAGVHDLRSYVGDIADQHEQEAEVAKKFLRHQVRRIGEWAALELQQAKAEARYWRQMEEEMHIP
jgi:hypothetical protein